MSLQLIRLHIGQENVQDLISDLEQGLSSIAPQQFAELKSEITTVSAVFEGSIIHGPRLTHFLHLTSEIREFVEIGDQRAKSRQNERRHSP